MPSVSASAGSGKTQVLTGRVLSLLMNGADPESILCLTFTKAGAAEMANRIGARLAAWVRLSDAQLRKELYALRGPNDPAALQRARRLFAKVLEAPGGLRIQTIHSFAQTLLSAFPAEAGITPGFKPIEGRAEQELAKTTLAALLAEAETRRDEQLIADVQCLSLRLGEEGAVKYLMLCAQSPDAMAALGAPEEIEPTLRQSDGSAGSVGRRLPCSPLPRRPLRLRPSRSNRRCEPQMGRADRARLCPGHRGLARTDADRAGGDASEPCAKSCSRTRVHPVCSTGQTKVEPAMRIMPVGLRP